MAKGPLDLAKARILVTNDDGIDAAGLKVLARIAKSLSPDVWVVAPAGQQSAASHALTLGRPLRMRRHGPQRFSVEGTPTDCALLALRKILTDRPPDLVLSGINHGHNLGEDVHYSGTVAAATEAALLGLPAVAFSQMRGPGGRLAWATAEAFAPRILAALAEGPWARDVVVNVNFPPLPPDQVTGIRASRQGRRLGGIEILETPDPWGRPNVWIGDFASHRDDDPRSDLRAVAEGAVAVTPLHLDMTHQASLKRLSAQLTAVAEESVA